MAGFCRRGFNAKELRSSDTGKKGPAVECHRHPWRFRDYRSHWPNGSHSPKRSYGPHRSSLTYRVGVQAGFARHTLVAPLAGVL